MDAVSLYKLRVGTWKIKSLLEIHFTFLAFGGNLYFEVQSSGWDTI